jgi:uncharacterized protein (TIGR02145 family)
MKTVSCIVLMTIAFTGIVYGQTSTIELTFTATYYDQHVPLDSILIENLTQGGDTMLYAPDTVLVLDYSTGIPENPALNTGDFRLSQNRPNPFEEKTFISIFQPEAGPLLVSVTNLTGQKLAFYENSLPAGRHEFVFHPGNDRFFILSATFGGVTKAIKMLNLGNNPGKTNSLIYQGRDESQPGQKSGRAITGFVYSPGDQLRFIGYAGTPSEIPGSDVIEDTPDGNENYVFEIIEGLPCPGTPVVTYEGQTYITVQIGTQCWLKQNLNLGTMILINQNPSNNGVIEKFCYDDDLLNCNSFGGLYFWDEMMQYSIAQGTQGICPENWHLPAEAEWCTVTQFIDPSVSCYAEGWSGLDVGTKMKSTSGWNSGGNGTNASGYNALPGGHYVNNGGYLYEGLGAFSEFWTSTTYMNSEGKWVRNLSDYNAGVYRYTSYKNSGLFVRCVKNEGSATIPTVTTAEISGYTETTATGGGEVTDDGGAEVQFRGVCWSTSQNPTFADNHTSDGTGMGTFVSELTGLSPNTPYFVRAYAINSAGYAYGNEVTFATLPSGFSCGDIVSYEGQNYNTVLIGTQCWFKENLNVGTMIDVSQNQTNNSIIEKYCIDNNTSNCTTYGGLYQWDEMMQYTIIPGVRGICPENWHLPTDEELTALTDYVSSQPEYLCNFNTNYIAKSLAASTYWNTSSNICAIGNNLSANNATGFTALPGGLRWPDGLFSGLNLDGDWWSSTQFADPDYACKRWLFFQQATVNWGASQKTFGFSVRCVKND